MDTTTHVPLLAGLRRPSPYGWLLALGGGLALGIVSRLGDGLPPALAWLVNIGGPWLALAFALGALAGAPRRGLVYGIVTLVSAVAGYYGWMHVVEGQANLAYLVHIAAFWLAVALVGGAVFGLAGAAWRGGRWWPRVIAAALLSATLAGESVDLLARPYDAAQKAVIGIELLAALLLPWLLLRERRATLMAALLTGGGAVLALGALVALRMLLRLT